jgi:hypothetical protein
MGEPGARPGLLCPAQPDRLLAGLVRQQFDIIMLTDATAFCFEPADAFMEFAQAFLGARLIEVRRD